MEPRHQQQDGNSILLIVTTFESIESAKRAVKPLIEHRLAACAQFIPTVRSMYWWQGQLVESDETTVWLKTKSTLRDQCIQQLKANHPYTVPEIVVIEPESVDATYAQWVHAETA